MTWNLIPVECGLVKIPRVKVLDRRNAVQVAGAVQPAGGSTQGTQGSQGVVESQAEGEEVEVVDVRWDGRPERVEDEEGNEVKVVKGRDGYVLVLP